MKVRRSYLQCKKKSCHCSPLIGGWRVCHIVTQFAFVGMLRNSQTLMLSIDRFSWWITIVLAHPEGALGPQSLHYLRKHQKLVKTLVFFLIFTSPYRHSVIKKINKRQFLGNTVHLLQKRVLQVEKVMIMRSTLTNSPYDAANWVECVALTELSL